MNIAYGGMPVNRQDGIYPFNLQAIIRKFTKKYQHGP